MAPMMAARSMPWRRAGAGRSGVERNRRGLRAGMPGGFTLVELLVVVAIIVTMMALIVPAYETINQGGDITKATYDVSGALQTARSFATSGDTYVWVGFYEENGSGASTMPATTGTGRIVVSTIASMNGAIAYNPATLASTSGTAAISGTSVEPVGKLLKIDNMHLKTAIANDPVFPIGSGTGSTLAGRPSTATSAAIGDTPAASASAFLFQYPVGGGSGAAQYKFSKVIQFNPRGEATVIINNVSYPIAPVVEIGLQPTHGAAVQTASLNVAAVQITGIAGNVNIYRR